MPEPGDDSGAAHVTADEELAEHARRLTPREWRVVALLLEGVSGDAACEALGIASGTLESHKQAIRRKLGAPRGQRLGAFLRARLGSTPIAVATAEAAGAPRAAGEGDESAPSDDDDDRRIRLLLRITLRELSEVAASAELRAKLLAEAVGRMGSAARPDAEREVRELEFVALDLRATYERVLEQVRTGAFSMPSGS